MMYIDKNAHIEPGDRVYYEDREHGTSSGEYILGKWDDYWGFQLFNPISMRPMHGMDATRMNCFKIVEKPMLIIVGNGPSATLNSNGYKINNFHKVVRINDFKIEGYEWEVGKRTDILFTCRLNEYNSPEKIAAFPEVVLSLLMNPLEGVEILPEVINAPNVTAHLDWFYAGRVAEAAGIPDPYYPSTGLICIFYMLSKGYDVTITGFDNFKDGNRHYFREGDRPQPPRHSGEHEREYINKLINNGKIKTL